MLGQAKLWFLAARPWSYSVSIAPVVLGTLLAWLDGCPLQWDLFLMTLFSGVLLHSGCNYLNTYGDYREEQVSGLMFWSARYHTQFGVLFAAALLVAGLAR